MHLPFGCRDAAPRFSAIAAGRKNAMIDDAIKQHSCVIEGIIASPDRSFASVLSRKEQADADWLMVVNSFGHISAVCDTPELNSEYQAVLPPIHAYQAVMSQNAALQDAVEAIRDSNEKLSPVDTGAMSLALRDFQGSKFRCEVLARGGSRDALESYRAFRGRDAHDDAMLCQRDLTA